MIDRIIMFIFCCEFLIGVQNVQREKVSDEFVPKRNEDEEVERSGLTTNMMID